MNDEAMVSLFLKRDERAISEVKAEYGSVCERAAQNLLGDAHSAEEAFSDALMALWNSIPPEKPRSLKAYVLGITKKCALKAYREKTAQKRGGNIRIESLDELASYIPGGEGTESRAEARALSELLNRWLGELPAEDRALFLKRYWFEESVSDIAKAAGEAPSWAASRLFSLRKNLRNYLEKEGFSI